MASSSSDDMVKSLLYEVASLFKKLFLPLCPPRSSLFVPIAQRVCSRSASPVVHLGPVEAFKRWGSSLFGC